MSVSPNSLRFVIVIFQYRFPVARARALRMVEITAFRPAVAELLEGLLCGHPTKIEQHLVPEAHIQWVQHRVLASSTIFVGVKSGTMSMICASTASPALSLTVIVGPGEA
jgi:hypothetical protein